MIVTLFEKEILSLLETFLIFGIKNQSEKIYATKDKDIVLVVNPSENYIQIQSFGLEVFQMHYQLNNQTWKEVLHPLSEEDFTERATEILESINNIYLRLKKKFGIRLVVSNQ
ncbi:hypothetical protein SAMN05421743_101232 [Thalassobacillus cyri]|uniref:Uncharacterized protein n=1 Tax=Thalassobacillus cyri TaxID=571932 RepID=A0A1H3VXN3_9BACI|nr:hypothetical protein [Thalassobacillus cyri]SDZ79583.1 hypothetical protein SAMN05421743_101232 [Thalassobacillus cyri]